MATKQKLKLMHGSLHSPNVRFNLIILDII